MCPYRKSCKIQHQYAGTDLCQDRYTSCAGYMYTELKGTAAVPDWLKALDDALLQK